MAIQIGIGTFLGSDGGVTGYCDDSGRALIRMKSSLDKAKWKRLPSMAGSREAARYFGAASSIAAGIWRNVPAGLKRLMDSGAFNRLVATVRGALGEDGNVCDFSGLEGISLSEGSLFEWRDERLEMRVSRAAGIDEGLRMKDESGRGAAVADERSRIPRGRDKLKDESSPRVVSRGRYMMAQRFLGAGVVCCAPTDENLGAMADLKAGLAAVRASEGKLVRRRRIWVQACEVGTVEVAGRGASGRFLLVQRGTQRLGRAGWVSPWMLSAEEFDARLAAVRGGELGFELPLGCGTGVYVVIVGTEVAEKRGRHWVRMPYCCGVGVEFLNQNSQDSQNCLNQNSQDSQNSQNGLEQNCFSTSRAPLKQTIASNSQDSQDSQNGLEQNFFSTTRLSRGNRGAPLKQTIASNSQDFQNDALRSEDMQHLENVGVNGEVVDLRGVGMVLEFKDLWGGDGGGFDCRDTGFKILNPYDWVGGWNAVV